MSEMQVQHSTALQTTLSSSEGQLRSSVSVVEATLARQHDDRVRQLEAEHQEKSSKAMQTVAEAHERALTAAAETAKQHA
eukprot:SAG22_NODE_7036_length_783_cov_1.052632_2_plen_79_part_01